MFTASNGTGSSSSSVPYEYRFDSAASAAHAFSDRNNPLSFAEGREFGAAIIRVDVFETVTVTHSFLWFTWTTTQTTSNIIDSFYTFGTRRGGIGGVTRGPIMTHRNDFRGAINTSDIPRAPNNHTTHTEVAQVHTHGPYAHLRFYDPRGVDTVVRPDLGFSTSDITAATRRGVDTFMVDHRGNLHFASYANNFTDAGIIATGLPSCPWWQQYAGGPRDIRDLDYYRQTGRRRNLPAW